MGRVMGTRGGSLWHVWREGTWFLTSGLRDSVAVITSGQSKKEWAKRGTVIAPIFFLSISRACVAHIASCTLSCMISPYSKFNFFLSSHRRLTPWEQVPWLVHLSVPQVEVLVENLP